MWVSMCTTLTYTFCLVYGRKNRQHVEEHSCMLHGWTLPNTEAFWESGGWEVQRCNFFLYVVHIGWCKMCCIAPSPWHPCLWQCAAKVCFFLQEDTWVTSRTCKGTYTNTHTHTAPLQNDVNYPLKKDWERVKAPFTPGINFCQRRKVCFHLRNLV